MSSLSLLKPWGNPFVLEGIAPDFSSIFTKRHSLKKFTESGFDLSLDAGVYQFYDFQRSTNEPEISLALSIVSVTYRAGAVLKAIEKHGWESNSLFQNIIAFCPFQSGVGPVVQRSLIVVSDNDVGSDELPHDKFMIASNGSGQCLNLYPAHTYKVLACSERFRQ